MLDVHRKPSVHLCQRGEKKPPTEQDLATVEAFREQLAERGPLPILGAVNAPDLEPEPIRRETGENAKPIENPGVQMYPGDEWKEGNDRG